MKKLLTLLIGSMFLLTSQFGGTVFASLSQLGNHVIYSKHNLDRPECHGALTLKKEGFYISVFGDGRVINKFKVNNSRTNGRDTFQLHISFLDRDYNLLVKHNRPVFSIEGSGIKKFTNEFMIDKSLLKKIRNMHVSIETIDSPIQDFSRDVVANKIHDASYSTNSAFKPIMQNKKVSTFGLGLILIALAFVFKKSQMNENEKTIPKKDPVLDPQDKSLASTKPLVA